MWALASLKDDQDRITVDGLMDHVENIAIADYVDHIRAFGRFIRAFAELA